VAPQSYSCIWLNLHTCQKRPICVSKETYKHQKRPTKETWTYMWHICGTSGMFAQSNESTQMSKEIYRGQRDLQKRPTKETWTVKYDTSADVYTSFMFAQSIESIHMSQETCICQNELLKRPTMMMIAFITFESSLVPLFEGLWSSNSWEFEVLYTRHMRGSSSMPV